MVSNKKMMNICEYVIIITILYVVSTTTSVTKCVYLNILGIALLKISLAQVQFLVFVLKSLI